MSHLARLEQRWKLADAMSLFMFTVGFVTGSAVAVSLTISIMTLLGFQQVK